MLDILGAAMFLWLAAIGVVWYAKRGGGRL